MENNGVNTKKFTSRIPILRELCPNLMRGGHKPGRLRGLFTRGKEKTEQVENGAEWRREERVEAPELAQQLEMCRSENQTLKAKMSEYECLCFSLDRVFEHYSGGEGGGGGRFEEACGGSDGGGRHKEPSGGSDLLSLFVENVILRSKQALQEERLQALTMMLPPATPSPPLLPPSIPLSPPTTPPSETTNTGELCDTETQLNNGQLIGLGVQDSPQQKAVVFNASTNTSFTQETVQEEEYPEVVDTATNTSHTRDITETGVNTSLLGDCGGDTVDAGTNTSLRSSETEATRRLEVAQLSNSLLRASLDDCQQQISSLEAASEALREEVRRKDVRLTTLSATLAEVARTFESQDSEVARYRQLYHQSVQHTASLQGQLGRLQGLCDKLKKIDQLKELALAGFAENKTLLDSRFEELIHHRQAWKNELEVSVAEQGQVRKECEDLRRLCEALMVEREELVSKHSNLLSRHAIAHAVHTLEGERIHILEESAHCKEAEIRKLKKKLARCASLLERSQKEHRENVEFSEAERTTLFDTNTELESEVLALQESLRERNRTIGEMEADMKAAKECISRLEGEQSQAREFILSCSTEIGELRGSVKETCAFMHSLQTPFRDLIPQQLEGGAAVDNDPAPSLDTDSSALTDLLRTLCCQLQTEVDTLTESKKDSATLLKFSSIKSQPSTSAAPTDCPSCHQLRGEVETALRALNERGCVRYGDLLREKFSLQQQVKQLSGELGTGEAEFQRLTSYMREYQDKSTQKIGTLKENLTRADCEIAELDRLVDQVREVLHANVGHVKKCKPLLCLLQELDGSEAPDTY